MDHGSSQQILLLLPSFHGLVILLVASLTGHHQGVRMSLVRLASGEQVAAAFSMVVPSALQAHVSSAALVLVLS